ncbi:hypothetical protein ACIOWI_33075 [Streptomyces sp. NPDC087659]|uniref:hypothetical protein n=1 Tax=Streptomyces sp. NPDC087659 TaxID=3365801 RepID=UPI00382B517D
MTDLAPLLLSGFIEDADDQRTAASLALLALTDDSDTLLDTVQALPPDCHNGVITALAQLSGVYLALACGKEKARAAAARRRVAEDDLAIAVAQAESARLLAEQAESEARKAIADHQAAEAAVAAAASREAAARTELAAQEAEDAARLTPRERAERKIARMILTAHATLPVDQRPPQPDMYGVSLEEVSDAIGVARTAASERRQGAYELILSGYTG